MSEKINPCPFCGSQHVELICSGSAWFVTCLECDACGSFVTDGEDDDTGKAVRSWNISQPIQLGALDPQQRLDVARGAEPLSADELERYYMMAGDGPGVYPQEEPDGEWCLYEDAQRLLAQRDAELAAVESDCVQIIAAQDEKHRQQLKALRQHKTDYMEAAEGTRRALNARIAELEAREVALPERKVRPEGWAFEPLINDGWNACLDEFARLNAKPQAQESEDQGEPCRECGCRGCNGECFGDDMMGDN